MLFAAFGFASGQQSNAPAVSFPTSIQWAKQKGVTRYRLQIADDQFFHQIFFDGRVVGERYLATGLPPGYYYWRAAPADSFTGQFSQPVRFFVSGGAVVVTPISEKAARRTRMRNTNAGRVH